MKINYYVSTSVPLRCVEVDKNELSQLLKDLTTRYEIKSTVDFYDQLNELCVSYYAVEKNSCCPCSISVGMVNVRDIRNTDDIAGLFV